MKPDAASTIDAYVRWMVRSDLPAVLSIESRSFDSPWTRSDFAHVMTHRCSIAKIAEVAGDVAGFVVYELNKAKFTLVNLAVNPQHRRLGVGAQLVGNLVRKLHADGRTAIEAAVRERNLAAQLFFRSLQFRAVQTIRRYYDDTGEDAYLFRYAIAAPANRIAQFLA